jgi:hypothetical protein
LEKYRFFDGALAVKSYRYKRRRIAVGSDEEFDRFRVRIKRSSSDPIAQWKLSTYAPIPTAPTLLVDNVDVEMGDGLPFDIIDLDGEAIVIRCHRNGQDRKNNHGKYDGSRERNTADSAYHDMRSYAV